MNSWKVILATMVIFATGVVTGGLLVYHVDVRAPHVKRPGATAARPPAAPSAGVMRVEFLRRAQKELDLTPEQRERIDKIIKDSQERTRKIMEPVLQHTRQEFIEVLTPEQRAKFEEMVKQQQQRWREQRRQAANKEHPEALGPTNAPPAQTNAP